jgi:hypothetical protein
MSSNSPRERAEQNGMRIVPGGRPGDPERAETHSPPDKPGQSGEESDRKIKEPPSDRRGVTEPEKPRLVPGEASKGPRQPSQAEGEDES